MRNPTPLLVALVTAFLLAGCFDPGTPAVQKSRPTSSGEGDDEETPAEGDDDADSGTGGGPGSDSGSGSGGSGPGASAPGAGSTNDSAPPTAPAVPGAVPAPEVAITFEIMAPSASPDAGDPAKSKIAGLRIEPATVNITAPSLILGTVTNNLAADAPDQASMNFTIPLLNVTVGPVKKGQTLTFEVRVDATGTYEYFIDGPRNEHDTYKAAGLKGTLNAVEPTAG